MDVKPMTKKGPSNLPSVPVNKPKSLTDIAVEWKTSSDPQSDFESDSEADTEAEYSDPEDGVEFDNPKELKEAFRDLFNKLHRNISINNKRNIDIYNKLVLMLGEMEG